MIGIGFPERNDSFDFIAGLEDFRKQLKIVNGTQAPATTGKNKEKDYSLKEGEKISITIPGLTKKTTDKPAAPLLGGGGGLKKLAPPPGAKKTSAMGQASGFS